MEDLVEYGHVRRPRIGVSIGDVAPEDAEVYGLPSVSGVLVQTVEADGPARGVLQPEDVVVAIEGEPVGYVAELQAKIAEHHPGDRVAVTVYRDKRRMDVTVRLAEAPINDAPTVVAQRSGLAEERLGIRPEELDAELAESLGYESAGGVVLSEVAPGSAAARRGVGQYQGQRLVRINESPIVSTQDVGSAVARVSSGQIVSLHFEDREGVERVVNVRMP
jgi:S1-C subfamily serine protease